MRLKRLYTNLDNYFKPIAFNHGLNIILGKSTNLNATNMDSHNLGKSLLIDVIDYCLLKRVSKENFTKKLPDELQDIEFYLELELPKNSFVTIKRSIKNNTKISFKEHGEPQQNYCHLSEKDWNQYELPHEKAMDFLDGLIGLSVIKPYNYRKGITYFLRSQKDFNNVFHISKFSASKGVDWKPYVGKILGFSSEVIENKYNCDKLVKEKETELVTIRKELTLSGESFDKIRARTEVKRQAVLELEKKLDAFDFKEKDLDLGEKELPEIEANISYINNEIYNLNHDLGEISKSLKAEIFFKIGNVQKIFNEANLHFKEPLVKEYKDLENFNNRLTKDRRERLKKEKSRINKKLDTLKEQLEKFNQEKIKKLDVLREKDSFKKYKKMQGELVFAKEKLIHLEKDLENFKKIDDRLAELDIAKKDLDKKVKDVREENSKDNPTFTKIRSSFNSLINAVLEVSGLVYVNINKQNNFDFHADYTKQEDPTSSTSEGDGTSYKKLLCVFFDMAVQKYYSKSNFYHFIYHDGVLEGLDDRKKIALLKSIREYSENYGIQYILTAIDSDLPLDRDGKKIHFPETEVIRKLTDEGDEGRLFNCPVF